MNSSSLDMRKIIIYIFLAVTAMLFSCQKPELTDLEIKPVQGTEVGNEATISFSALVPGDPDTKAMTETPTDLVSMHLVIFDGNGMYVETREAKKGAAKTHDGHNYETTFEVTLTVTDQPRIIHFIANCPVEQIIYGHEASIIGNMYTTKAGYTPQKDDDPSATESETSYWARVEVPYILVEETSEGSGKYRPVPGIIGSFQCVPMLRNYAQVIVKDGSNTTEFDFIGFTLYNTIDIGTIAPYNNTTQKFQNFVNSATGKPYKYPNLAYQGHALSAADLNTSLEKDSTSDDGYKWYTDTNPFYMYERKISVKTDEEDKWSESPPHVIIKGRYNGKINYYKVDLVYNVYEKDENGKDTDKVVDILYYNILRNFRYQFTISEVVGEGYPTVEEAINGSTSNNLAGSSTTSKFTNISDKVGRIWVSYTDTTLVSNNAVTLKYKYIPNISNQEADDYEEVHNELVTLEGIVGGDVIDTYQVDSEDISGGTWDGFREVTMTIKNPEDMTKEQTVVVKTDNANLTRDVRYYLKQEYPLVVECTPKKVEPKIGVPVEVDIKLPVGLTDDMFPLDLDIEVYDMSLSPDASKPNNTMPVVTGPSTIDSKNGKVTFHFVKTIETKEEYDAIVAVGTQKIIKTYWLTNMAANESVVWVSNKYFTNASDNFVNAKSFVSLTLNNGNTVREGAGRTVSATLVLPESDNSYASRNIQFKLEGLSYNGSTEPFYVTPTSRTVTINNLVTTDASSTLKITAEEDSYAMISASVGRRRGTFSNLTFSQNGTTVTSLPSSTLQNVDFTFEMSDYEDGMPITVELEGLEPADDALTRSTIYTYKVKGTGKQTIKLKTVAGLTECWVKLSADGFDASEQKKIQLVDKQTVTASLTFNNTNKRTSRTNQKQVWTENNITFTNNKNQSNTNVSDQYNPIRLYSKQNVIVSVPSGGVITKIVFTCSSNTYATTLQSSIGNSATKSGSTVTVTLDGTSSEYTISSLSGEVRLSSISVTYDK